MKKKALSILLTLALMTALLCTAALGTGANLYYADESGAVATTGDYTTISENAEAYTFESNTVYCVYNDITLGTVTAKAGAKLVIGKSAKLTINKLEGLMGIDDEPLKIFGARNKSASWGEADDGTCGECNIKEAWGAYVTLYGGKYNALPEDSQWWSVGEQFVFRYTENGSEKYTHNYFVANSDYTVVKCDHSAGYGNDGCCDTCRYQCPHTTITEGKCAVCRKAMEAQIGETPYMTFAEAVGKAKDGDTIKLLADTAVNSYTIDKKLTIDLNNHTLKSDSSAYKAYKSEVTVKNGTVTHMTLTGSGSKVTFSGTVTVTNMRVESGAALSGGEGLTVNSLVVTDATNVALTAGTFGEIKYSGDFGDLLGEHDTSGIGYAFGDPQNEYLRVKLPNVKNDASIKNVTIYECGYVDHEFDSDLGDGKCLYCKETCSHNDDADGDPVDENGKCNRCGIQIDYAKIGATSYKTFDAAYAAADAAKTTTITLLADCDCGVDLAKPLYIDLNGKTLKRGEHIAVTASVTIKNGTVNATVDAKEGAKLWLNGVTFQENRALNIDKGEVSLSGSSALRSVYVSPNKSGGTLNVSGSSTVQDLHVHTGGTVTLGSGTFGKITRYESAPTFAQMLPSFGVYASAEDATVRFKLSELDEKELSNVQVVTCSKHMPEDGESKCAYCSKKLEAKITRGGEDIYYVSLNNARGATRDGDTLTLLTDAGDYFILEDKTLTLDLNGKRKTSTMVIKSGGKLTLKDSASAGGGTVKAIEMYGGSLTMEGGGADEIKIRGTCDAAIKGGNITALNVLSADQHVTLSGGTFGSITTAATDSSRPLAAMLAEGYVFKFADGSISYDPNGENEGKKLTSVSVVEHKQCDFKTYDSDSHQFTCACGRTNDWKTVWYQAYNTTTGEFEKKTCNEYTMIENALSASYNGEGAYVVEGQVTITDSLGFGESANLILCDGATLTVKNGLRAYGNLTIYGGEKGTGKLVVTKSSVSGNECNAINMDFNGLIVHGGNITATATADNAEYSRGILAGSMTVYGGAVTGNGGNTGDYSEGIHTKSTMTVFGGTVTGTGGTTKNSGYGIHTDGGLTVSGGTVKATGGDAGNYSYGIYVYGDDSTISGGTVIVASGKEGRPVGMGVKKLTVSGGTLKLTEGSSMTKLTVSGSVTLSDLLADGCAYRKRDKDEPFKLADLSNPLESVKIVTHDHDYGEDGKCVYCGKTKPSASSGGGSNYAVAVSGAENGAVTADAKKAKAGDTVTITVTPDEGYEVASVTVLDKNGNEVAVTENADGTYSFTMPAGKVTIHPSFTPLNPPSPTPDTPLDTPSFAFSDVPEDAWFAEAVAWAVGRGITAGTGGNAFSPEQNCSRTELVTFLWRAAGSPAPQGVAGFVDVKAEGEFYSEAVAWAVENGLVNGCGNGLFCPENPITREEVATILYRFVKLQGSGFTGAWAFRMPFDDIAEVSGWAWEAVCWCYKEGIMQGFANNLMPKEECTRAQIVTMLHRLLAE